MTLVASDAGVISLPETHVVFVVLGLWPEILCKRNRLILYLPA